MLQEWTSVVMDLPPRHRVKSENTHDPRPIGYLWGGELVAEEQGKEEVFVSIT